MARTLIIKTDNPNYSGKTFGVQFSGGTAVVSEAVANPFGYSIDTLADKFKRDVSGYTAQIVEEVNTTPTMTTKKVKE